MKKRILALLTAVMMFSSVVPVLADETTPETVNGYDEVIAGQDLECFVSANHPTYPIGTVGSGIYAGEKFIGGLGSGRGAVYANMDFGDGADEMILDVKMAINGAGYDTTNQYLTFKAIDSALNIDEYNCQDKNHNHPEGGITFKRLVDYNVAFNATEVAQARGFDTNGWDDYQIRHYAVPGVAQLKGVKNIAFYLQNGSSFNNVYSFQFNKVVSPYKALLTETITDGKEIKSLDFDALGADKVTLTYNQGATGTVSIYKDTINGSYTSDNYLLDTITLDGTGSQIVELDREKYKGYADLYFKVSEGVELSQVAFNEFKTNDGYAEVVVARDFDYYISSNRPSISTAGKYIYAGQQYFGGLSGGKGAVFEGMDFGEGADEIILDVKMALSPNYNTEDYLKFRVMDQPIVVSPTDPTQLNSWEPALYAPQIAQLNGIKTGDWEDFQIRHYSVADVSKLKGIQNVVMHVQGGSRFSNIYSFQFNKAVNPYQELLAEKITSAKGKEIKSLDFDALGADKVTLTYNQGATGTVSIYKDSINGYYKSGYLHESITLDGSGNQTVELDRENYKGYADFYFEVTDGVELSQVEFSEYEMPDNFGGKTEIKATYIGYGEWSAETKSAFEEKNAYPDRKFVDTYYELLGKTDMDYLDFISTTDFSGADVIFVEANNRAEGILDALVAQESEAKTVVIGNASYAKAYGVAAVSNDELGLPETYNVPTYMINDDPYTKINTIDYDLAGGPTVPKQEGDKNHTNQWSKDSYAVFNSYRFTKGIKEVKIEHAHAKHTTSMRVSFDGIGTIMVADFTALTPTGSYNPPYKTTSAPAIRSVNGVHDVYLYQYSNDGNNISTIEFVPYDKITSQVGMDIRNWTNVSDNVEAAFDAFNNFGAGDTVEYAVDFGDKFFKKNFVINAAAPRNTTGNIVMKLGDVEIARFDLRGATGNFQSIEAVSYDPLFGEQNITLAYEGEGECSIKGVTFSDYITLDTTFDYSNYYETSGSKNANGYIGGLGNGTPGAVNYVKWLDVDFDGEDELWDLTLTYAIPSKYAGSEVTVYADRIGGPVIAKAILIDQKDAPGMGWEVFRTVTVPVTYMPEGTHDLYIHVTKSDYSTADMALNLKGMKFSKYEGDEEYRVDYRTIAKGQENTPKTANATLTFVKDNTTPANYIFAAAVYDKTTGQLKDVKTVNGTTVEGTNSASIVYNYADVKDYDYKCFVWDGTTLMPLRTPFVPAN